jgi:hypothetical protein
MREIVGRAHDTRVLLQLFEIRLKNDVHGCQVFGSPEGSCVLTARISFLKMLHLGSTKGFTKYFSWMTDFQLVLTLCGADLLPLSAQS